MVKSLELFLYYKKHCVYQLRPQSLRYSTKSGIIRKHQDSANKGTQEIKFRNLKDFKTSRIFNRCCRFFWFNPQSSTDPNPGPNRNVRNMLFLFPLFWRNIHTLTITQSLSVILLFSFHNVSYFFLSTILKLVSHIMKTAFDLKSSYLLSNTFFFSALM